MAGKGGPTAVKRGSSDPSDHPLATGLTCVYAYLVCCTRVKIEWFLYWEGVFYPILVLSVISYCLCERFIFYVLSIKTTMVKIY